MNKHHHGTKNAVLNHQWLFCGISCKVSLSGTQVKCLGQTKAQLDEGRLAGMQRQQLHPKDQLPISHFFLETLCTEGGLEIMSAWFAV